MSQPSASATFETASDQELLAPLTDYPEHGLVRARAAERARATDEADTTPFETLRELGQRGLLDLGLGGGDLRGQAAVVFDLAAECTATAFSLWGHRSGLEYLDAVGAPVASELRTGDVPLCSAMAPAFKAAAGIGEIPVTLTRRGDHLVLDGTVPWASNLYPDAVVILPVVREDGRPAIVRTRVALPGVSVRPLENLMALNATASGILRLEGVEIDAEQDVLTEDVPGFLATVRGPFLLLQTSFCLGLSAAALTSARENLGGVGEMFREDLDDAVAEQQRLRADLVRLAREPRAAAPRELLQLRLDAALLTGEATRLEAKIVGGRGYALSSPTARRAREAAFLPVQSPTEGHLRWELRRLG
ncbi:acyl-CoA dehydrogenase family protein [Kocuria sp. KD4]|uniref:acyl-CoA dehydrogenase family protein n=1 Tax=Kocuria sp. KD4 TaxID=2719588 RepID=UPI001427A073|nr:acyl-CoA dehydrogenase family protein [Kocuria sp. KD4]QIR69818.1 acyl-CoA/acyl-ACP dehydrogenase [Kocuria sp. KD4]